MSQIRRPPPVFSASLFPQRWDRLPPQARLRPRPPSSAAPRPPSPVAPRPSPLLLWSDMELTPRQLLQGPHAGLMVRPGAGRAGLRRPPLPFLLLPHRCPGNGPPPLLPAHAVVDGDPRRRSAHPPFDEMLEGHMFPDYASFNVN
jgi:hypothetical protein